MTDFPTTQYIHITGSISGSSLTVSSIYADAAFSTSVFDDDNSGTASGGDYWAITDYQYTGFTVQLSGNDYALFESTSAPGNFYLPHNGEIDYTDLGITAPGQSFAVTANSNATVINCFTGDALIRTPRGEVRIDGLCIGEDVLTADGRAVPVRWIGRQSLSPAQLSGRGGLVRVHTGALGPGVPHCDLTLTGDHGLILDGLVINAAVLVNGADIDWVPVAGGGEAVRLYHLETPDHDVIVANGAPAESFIDYLGRGSFENFADYLDLYGAERIIPEMRRPRISTRRMLPARVAAQLGLTGAEAPRRRSA